MTPSILQLDGDWEFGYQPDVALDSVPRLPGAAEFTASMPVPAFWDDHIERLRRTAMWGRTRFNPNARPIAFPVGDNPPDASLPYLLGVGWYRRRFAVPAGGGEGCATLRVGGAVMDAWVWINGAYVGHHMGHSTAFDLPLEPHVRGGANELVIAVANTREDRTGCSIRGQHERSGGLYRSVSLHLAGDARIRSLYLRPADEGRRIVWRLEADGAQGIAPDTRGLEAQWEILDRATGASIERGTAAVTGAETEWSSDARTVRAWSDRDPALYRVRVRLARGGATLDERDQEFGLRRLGVDGFALKLNGQPAYLRGVCEHHYFPLTCTAPADVETYRSNIRRLKAIGFNWLRFHTWVPSEEYMRAADELGMLIQVEPPYGAVTDDEWRDIFRACRHHPSVVIYCGGNEELLDEAKIDLLEGKAALMRRHVPDALFNPMEALRGVEYGWAAGNRDMGVDAVLAPYPHNPRRLGRLKAFSDVFGQYSWGHLSYLSVSCDVDLLERWLVPYERPCLSHELCITSNFINLDLEHRYAGTRIGPGLFTAVRAHLAEKGLLHKAATYYRNSCAMMRIIRKHAAESARKVKQIAGYDMLSGTDHHWHRTGYPCGIMNEFYELKPGESERDVLRYNGESVLLLYCTNRRNFSAGAPFAADVGVSLFGPAALQQGECAWTVRDDRGDVLCRGRLACTHVPHGAITRLGTLEFDMPESDAPRRITVSVTLDGGAYSLENAWCFWVFPRQAQPDVSFAADAEIARAWGPCFPASRALPAAGDRRPWVVAALDPRALKHMEEGGDVLLLGHAPFPAQELTFQGMPTGRPNGHRGLVVGDHPLLDRFPHEGFGDWQFYSMLEGGHSIVFDDGRLPFDPIIEVIPSYKNIRRQAALFEWRVGLGRLLVCSFNMRPDDPAACFLVSSIVAHMTCDQFAPRCTIAPADLAAVAFAGQRAEATGATDQALDPNVARKGGA